MSLVNDMLRDLDRRRRSPVDQDQARKVLDVVMQRSGGVRKVIAIAAGAVLAVVLAGYFVINNSVPQPAPQVANSADMPLQPGGSGAAAPDMSVTAEPEPAVTARIAGERNRSNGFELRLEATSKVPFEVLSRTGRTVSVLLTGVGELSNRITSIEGATAAIAGEGLVVTVAVDRESDFVVYENSNAFTFAVVIEGFWKAMPEVTSARQESNDTSMDGNSGSATESIVRTSPPAPAETAEAQNSRNAETAPVRTQRELSLGERDRNASQQALRQAQNGQMQPAYTSLYEFLSANPEAHQSRNTLITLLYAQQQYDQVGLLVEEGLSLAPNQSSYKKMKARLLMMHGRYDEAITLLRNVPPAVAEDEEYHELLASLYQQNGNYAAAVTVYQELIRTDSSVGRWWTGMGISHESMGNIQEAVNSFEVAMQVPGLESSLRQYSRNRIRALSGQ